MTLKIDLNNPASITAAVGQLNKYAHGNSGVQQRLSRCVRKAIDDGVDRANYLFSTQAVEGNGAANATSTAIHNGTASMISSGSDLYFNEFGTGIYADPSHQYAPNVGCVGTGTWSEQNSRQLVTRGYWFYHKNLYYGTFPTAGTYEGARKIEEKLKEYIGGEFK